LCIYGNDTISVVPNIIGLRELHIYGTNTITKADLKKFVGDNKISSIIGLKYLSTRRYSHNKI
jgi:hypothetical protein